MSKFNEMYSVDVSGNIEKKNGFSYLSWTYAWKYFKTNNPDASYEVQMFDGVPYVKCPDGYMVMTKVCDGTEKHEMWLAVTDYRNKSIEVPTSADIANSLMRCLVKNIAMFGLGLHIYAGEDVPQEIKADKDAKTDKDRQFLSKCLERAKEKIKSVDDYKALKEEEGFVKTLHKLKDAGLLQEFEAEMDAHIIKGGE